MYYKSILTRISIYECENTNSGIQKLLVFKSWAHFQCGKKKYANEEKKYFFFCWQTLSIESCFFQVNIRYLFFLYLKKKSQKSGTKAVFLLSESGVCWAKQMIFLRSMCDMLMLWHITCWNPLHFSNSQIKYHLLSMILFRIFFFITCFIIINLNKWRRFFCIVVAFI